MSTQLEALPVWQEATRQNQALSRHRDTVQIYQRALPSKEFAILVSWLSTFYGFQIDWLLDDAAYAVCCKSRQIGMSHTTAAWGVLRGVFHGELTTIVSVGDREATEVLEKAKDHREMLVELGSQLARRNAKNNASHIDFASGGRVIALPSSGGRGFTGNVFLDEFAYHQHPEKVWDAALAVTMHGFMARVGSTPNGVGNDFHSLWTDSVQNKGWSKHFIPLQRALDDGMRVDIENCWKLAKGDQRIYDQWYNCKFLDGELQYLPTALIKSCQVDDLRTSDGAYYAGLDIGKTADLTVLYVVRRVGKVRHTAYIETRKRTDAEALHAMVDRAFNCFNIRRLCVDSTGLGSFPAEQMRKRHGYYKVEPVTFTQNTKEDMATSLYSAFCDRTVLLPKRDASIPSPPTGMNQVEPDTAKDILQDLCSLRRVITTAGNVRYDAPHTDKGHADRAWALALALHASSGAQPSISTA